MPALDAAIPPGGSSIVSGLVRARPASLTDRPKPLTFAPGERIIQTGNAPDYIYLLTQGEVSVTIELAGGQRKRLSTLPGRDGLRRNGAD